MKLSLSILFCIAILFLSISSSIAQPGRQGNGQNNQNNNGTSFQGPPDSQNGSFGNQSAMNQQRNGNSGGFNNQGQQNQQGPQNGGFRNQTRQMGGQSAMNQQQNGGPGGFGSQNNGTRQQGQKGPSGFQDGGFGKQNDTRALPTDQSGFSERQGPGANLTSASSETSFATGFFGHFMVSLVIILVFGFIISVLFYRQELKKNGIAPFAAPSFCPKALYPVAPLAGQNIIEVDNNVKAHPLIEEGEGYDGVL